MFTHNVGYLNEQNERKENEAGVRISSDIISESWQLIIVDVLFYVEAEWGGPLPECSCTPCLPGGPAGSHHPTHTQCHSKGNDLNHTTVLCYHGYQLYLCQSPVYWHAYCVHYNIPVVFTSRIDIWSNDKLCSQVTVKMPTTVGNCTIK